MSPYQNVPLRVIRSDGSRCLDPVHSSEKIESDLIANCHYDLCSAILPQNALKRDSISKCIDLIEGHYLEVVVLL